MKRKSQSCSYTFNSKTYGRVIALREIFMSHYLLTYLITYLLTYLLTYILTYLLTYLLTPWCRVLLEKLTGLQLVKKFPAFHGTRRFITALTSVRYLSLSWASPIQSIYTHPTIYDERHVREAFLEYVKVL